MPKGPNGQKRKADVIGNAVLVMKIATGEVEETPAYARSKAGALGGKIGGKSRANKMAPEERSASTKRARDTGDIVKLIEEWEATARA